MRIFRNLPPDASETPCALAIGNFDGVHRGHMALLAQVQKAAKRLGITSTVLTFTPHPRQFFAVRAGKPSEAPTTITPLRSKLKAISEAGIDRTVLLRFNDTLANLSPDQFIEKILVKGLNAKWLIVGEKFHFGSQRIGTTEALLMAGKKYGFHVEILPAVKDGHTRISSSAVREALNQNDFVRVEELLGSPYHISGHIIHGDKRGHDLGFPTANLPMHDFYPVLSGVYITRVYGLSDEPLRAVSMIGTRPTIDETPRIVLETHVLDFDQSSYGALIHVEFLKKIRDSRKFPDMAALNQAIMQDVQTARDFFSDPHNIRFLSRKARI